MIKIVAPNRTLVKFLMSMNLRLSAPQQDHLCRFMEGIIACESTKTLSAISRLFWEAPDSSNLADFFRISPWREELMNSDVKRYLLSWAIQECRSKGKEPVILVSIDDSMAPKPRSSQHFESVDWHYDSTEGKSYVHGTNFLTMHLQVGDISFPFYWKLYLRERTVRRLNKRRNKSQRLRFQSKMSLAKAMLEDISRLLPPGAKVYVLFDSWYASKKLIRFIRSKNWHVICALKSNRVFCGRKLARIGRRLRNKSLSKVTLGSADASTSYWVCVKKGLLKGLPEEVSLLFSKRHPRDKSPAYFMSTDASLSARQVLDIYSHRWPVEVDHLYLKTRLGLADFRMRKLEAISKYFSTVFVTLCYLHWRLYQPKDQLKPERLKTLSQVIAQHRNEQDKNMLQEFGHRVLKRKAVEPVINNFLVPTG